MTTGLAALSISYFRRHAGKTALAIVAIAVGVAVFVSIRTAQRVMTSSFATSADRLAGHADLQITTLGGVPEIQDRLRALPVVDVVQPIIEQVVQPLDRRLGGLLVLAVDLAGDRDGREYGLDPDEADIDDPLDFIAQPDSIALSSSFAARAALNMGDTLLIRVAGTNRRLTVRALLPHRDLELAYGGNVAIMDVYAAQDLFARGRRFDRLEIRLRPSTPIAEGVRSLSDALGSGYRIETPARRGEELQQLVNTVVGGFDLISILALGIGAYLVFNVFAIAVERRRRDIGILRAIGATPWQASRLFLIEAGALGLVGGLIGAALGNGPVERVFQAMGVAIQLTRGVPAGASPMRSVSVTLQGMLIGVLASLVGAWRPARDAARVQPLEAIATGVFAMKPRPRSVAYGLVGIIAIAGASVLDRYRLVPGLYLLPAVVLTAAFGVILFAGQTASALTAPLLPMLARLAPASGRVASDALRQPKRTVATAATLTICAAFVLGTAGYLQAARASFDTWIANNVTSDLVIRTAPGWGRSTIHLPYDLRSTLQQLPGVRSIDSERDEQIAYRGHALTLLFVEPEMFAARVRLVVVSGDASRFTAPSTLTPTCIVTDKLAEQYGLKVGDAFDLNSPTGAVRQTIAAIVKGDRIAATMDRRVFRDRWGIDDADVFFVNLDRPAAAATWRDGLRSQLDFSVPVLVSTRGEFIEEMNDFLSAGFSVLRVTMVVILVMTLLAVAISQLIVVTERSRDIGVLRAIGAIPRQLGAAVVLEAVTLAATSLVVALPLGELFGWVLRARVSGDVLGVTFSHGFPTAALAALLIGLPCVGVVATLVPTLWAAGSNVRGTIAYD